MTESDFFKNVLRFLAVFGTVLSTLYYYLQKSTIHITWYSPVVDLITIVLISSFFIFIYGLVVIPKDLTKKIDRIVNFSKLLESQKESPRYGWETVDKIIMPSEIYDANKAGALFNNAKEVMELGRKFLKRSK